MNLLGESLKKRISLYETAYYWIGWRASRPRNLYWYEHRTIISVYQFITRMNDNRGMSTNRTYFNFHSRRAECSCCLAEVRTYSCGLFFLVILFLFLYFFVSISLIQYVAVISYARAFVFVWRYNGGSLYLI